MADDLREDIATIKSDLRHLREDVTELKKVSQTKEVSQGMINRIVEMIENLEKRVKKQEDNVSKITWIVITEVVTAVLYLVLR